MSSSALRETLAAAGYVKVICTLKPMMVADQPSLESALKSDFIIPSESQFASLAIASQRAAGRTVRQSSVKPPKLVRIYPNLGLALGFADASGVAALEAHPDVEKVVKAPELSLIRPVASNPVKRTKKPAWGISRLKVDLLWAAGYTGRGVVVGHLDTGIDGTHPALKGAIKSYAEFDMLGDHVAKAVPRDSGDHGTHTAGTIAGRSGSAGAFGVAPGAQLASAMVIEGGQVIDRILGGMDWIIGEGARILNMSLGLRGYTPAFQSIIDALRARNVLPIIAVGNEYANTSRSPGNYATVLSVGAMDSSDRVADFSGSQKFNRPKDSLVPDIVAPGVAVLSCVPGGGYNEKDGSSMATPHIAGLAALLLEVKPNATAQELEDAIVGSCSRPASMDQARGNHGVPDAVKAFVLLTGAELPSVNQSAGKFEKSPKSRKPQQAAVRSRSDKKTKLKSSRGSTRSTASEAPDKARKRGQREAAKRN